MDLDKHDETLSIASFCLMVVSSDSSALPLAPPILFSMCRVRESKPVFLVAETEKTSLKLTLMETYAIEEADIDEIIKDAENTVAESTSLYGYTRIVNDEFEYDDKLSLLKNLWKVAYADGNLDKYEEHLIRKISDLIHISHSDYINIKLEVRGD